MSLLNKLLALNQSYEIVYEDLDSNGEICIYVKAL